MQTDMYSKREMVYGVVGAIVLFLVAAALTMNLAMNGYFDEHAAFQALEQLR